MREISGMNGGIIEAYEPADLTVYLQSGELILKEKSLVAYDGATGKIAAVGTQAEGLMQSESLLVRSPLRQGVVADFEMAVVLFTDILRRALGRRLLRKPLVAVCVPPGLTKVEERAVEDAVHQAGAGQLVISDLPAQQLMHTLPLQDPGFYRKIKLIIGIEKDDPERYLMEQFSDTWGYARRMGISPEQAAELLRSAEHFIPGEK